MRYFLLNEEIYKLEILKSDKIKQSQIYRRIKFSDILRFIKYNLDEIMFVLIRF